jgi:tungstate transport system substrate-binding protein
MFKPSLNAAAVALALVFATPAKAEDPFIVVQSTTSTENSGLFKYLLPIFKQKTGIDVRVVAVGTGQALKNAENGDGDVVLVHAKAAEEKFVADGFGVKRIPVMYNDFVIVGPAADPAKVAGSKDAADALKKVAAAKAPFASRGDDSGTHKAELKLWEGAGVDVKAASGEWYRSTGSGMGQTLNTASGMSAYALADRASWSNFKNRGTLQIVVEGDPKLFNQYGVILVNPAKHKHVKAKEGQAFIDWLTGPEGQAVIKGFRIEGEQQFFPNAPQAELKKAG